MHKKRSDQNENNANTEVKDNQAPTGGNGEIRPTSDAPPTRRENQQTRRKQCVAEPTILYRGLKWSEWFTLVFTGVIALSAGTYTIFAILQWNVMAKQAELMEATLEVSQRAYVFPKHVRMKQFQMGKRLVVEVEVENSGNTPALNLSGTLHFRAIESALPDISDYGEPADGFTSVSVLPAHVSSIRMVSGRAELSERHVVSIEGGNLRVYVYGILRYQDIFGKQRESRFCGLYDPPTGLFKACERHNSMN